jgi:hypothetical protein
MCIANSIVSTPGQRESLPIEAARHLDLHLSRRQQTATRHCTENEIVRLMLLQKMCSRVSTFEVKATLVGDLNEWMTIPLDDAHASTVVDRAASSCCGRK